MTQDEIIDMASDSGMELYGLGKNRARFVYHLERFSKLVAAKEREACAKVCEANVWSKPVAWWGEATKSEVSVEAGLQCAAAIRARGEQA
jgi:hypothetical protein